MNRVKKEIARRRAEARARLSEAQIAALDAKEASDAALMREARGLHARIFPEEYDHMFDSGSDAKMRRRGANPMSDEAMETARRFRASLGFTDDVSDYTRTGPQTLDWVVAELSAGGRGKLEALATKREQQV